MQREHQFGRRAVGAVNGEAPAELVGFGADFGAMARDALLVVRLPGLGAAGGDRAAAFGLDELTRPEYGKVSSAGSTTWTVWPWAPVAESCASVLRTSAIGTLRNPRPPRSRRAPTARMRPAGSRAAWGRAGWRSPSCRARCGCRSAALKARHADALAGLHQNLGRHAKPRPARDRAWSPAPATT